MKYLTFFLRFLMSFLAFIGIYTLFSVYLFDESVTGRGLLKYIFIGALLAFFNTFINKKSAD